MRYLKSMLHGKTKTDDTILKRELEEIIYKILYFNLSTNHERKDNTSDVEWYVVIDKNSVKSSVSEIIKFFDEIYKNSLDSIEMFGIIFDELSIVNDYVSEKSIANATKEVYDYIDDNISKLLKRYDMNKNVKKYNL